MIVLIILMILVFSLFGVHMSYPFLLKRLSRKHLRNNYSNMNGDIDISEISTDFPLVSVIIPVYNEETVIERRIDNIFDTSYPSEKIEIIVVDSGSKDKTRSIIEERFSNMVTLLTEEVRKGKAHAINLALKICKGEMVIITDGPTLFDKGAIAQLVDSLKNSSVGGVSVLYKIPNADENYITASEHVFWLYKDKIRILESRVYSTSWLSGEACAFKKNIITKVNEDTLADDSNIALQLISKGYRAVINERSFFTEKSPSDIHDYFRIKARRTLGGLQETLRFKNFLFKRQYGYFGLVIFPYRFFAEFITPIASNIAMVLSVLAAVEISLYVGSNIAVLMVIMLSFIGFIFRVKVVAYLILHSITSIALIMLLTRRTNVLWSQSTTTRL